MLRRAELEAFTSTLGFTIWQVERDYLQHLLLLFLSRRTARELVFKGGTALQKAFALNRFSIDLDFTQQGELPARLFDSVRADVQQFGFVARYEDVQGRESRAVAWKIEGPLYQGMERTLAVVRMEVSMREKALMEPEAREIFPAYSDLQPYVVSIMRPEEILAEKVRAIFTRVKARDVFDLRFLLMKGITLDEALVNEKLKRSKLIYAKSLLLERIANVKNIWDKELRQLVAPVPDYPMVVRQIKEHV